MGEPGFQLPCIKFGMHRLSLRSFHINVECCRRWSAVARRLNAAFCYGAEGNNFFAYSAWLQFLRLLRKRDKISSPAVECSFPASRFFSMAITSHLPVPSLLLILTMAAIELPVGAIQFSSSVSDPRVMAQDPVIQARSAMLAAGPAKTS